MRYWYSLILPVLAAGALCGCGQANAEDKKPVDTAKGQSVSPSERYERERLDKALAGLKFEDGRVQVDLSSSGAIATRGTRAQSDAEALNAQKLLDANDGIGAVAGFAKAIIIDASNARAYVGLGKALMTQGEMAESTAATLTALDKDQSLVEARYNLAQNYQMAGEVEAQIGALTLIAKSNPGYKETEGRLAVACYYEGEYGQAWKWVHASERLGKPVPPQFRELLQSKMSETIPPRN